MFSLDPDGESSITDEGMHSRGGEEGGDPCSSAAEFFCQSALGHKSYFQIAR